MCAPSSLSSPFPKEAGEAGAQEAGRPDGLAFDFGKGKGGGAGGSEGFIEEAFAP